MTNTVTQPIFEPTTQAAAPILSDSHPRVVPVHAATAENDNTLLIPESVLVRRRRRARSRLAH